MIRIGTTAAVLLLCFGGPHMGRAQEPAQGPGATYEVLAVRFATLPSYPVRNLVAGADSARRMDLAMMVWVLRGADGRVVLVDAGFHRRKFIDRWGPRDYVTPAAAVARLGITPEDVTDVVLTHVHWDHVDGVDLFPRATVWIQRAEYEHHVGENGAALAGAIDPVDAEVLWRLGVAGRLELVDGDAREILPGVTVYTGGRHTFASQYVGVRTTAGTVVLASDNVYLYENLERRAPIAQTLDAASNLAAQDRMRRLSGGEGMIVPGHDPAVFERFPTPMPGIARIAPPPPPTGGHRP